MGKIYVWDLIVGLFLISLHCVCAMLALIALICVWAVVVSHGWERWRYLGLTVLFGAAPVYVFGFGWP